MDLICYALFNLKDYLLMCRMHVQSYLYASRIAVCMTLSFVLISKIA